MIEKGQSSKGYTKSKVLAAIKGSAGIRSTIAARLGCSWNTANALCKKWPETVEAMQDEREAILDMSETTLLKSIKDGDTGSAKWMLSTIGKERGYVERQEVTGKDGKALAISVEFVEPEKTKRKKCPASK
jgi:hypothetical protein